MVNQNLGITIYRIVTSTVSGIIVVIVGYVLMILIDSIIFDKFPYNDIDNKIMNNLETLISKPWIYLLLPIAFFVGEIFNMLGEFVLFYFFRFTYRGKDMISIYTKYDSEKEHYSFSMMDLMKAFGVNNQFINVSELLYSTARFFSGLTLILFVFVFFNACLFKIYSLKSLYFSEMEDRLSLLYLFLLFFGILIFILLVSPLIISWNKIAKLLERIENWIKTPNSGKSKVIFLVIFFTLFFILLYYLEKIVSFFYKIPYLGPIIIIIILIFSYLLFLNAIENENLFDKNPYLTRLIFYIYFAFIYFFIVANSFLINEKDKSLQIIDLNKDLTALLLRIIIYWFFLTHSFFISLLFKMKKYIHIIIFFIFLFFFIIMNFIFGIFFENEIKLLIFKIGLLVQLIIPLLIILAFILMTMANEIIFYVLKSQQKYNKNTTKVQ